MDPGTPRRLDPDQLGDHVDRLFRAAWALCGNPHDAEDLVQEVYARVLARPRLLRRDDDLGYLMRSLRNTHVSQLRGVARRPAEVVLDDDVHVVEGFDLTRPDVALEVSEVFAAIADLPAEGSEAIAMVDVAGLSYREAAHVLGIKEATLTTRLHRARRRVAERLTAEPTRSRR